MNYCRGVVPCVFALIQRITHHRFAQISLIIGTAHTLIYGLGKIALGYVYLLPKLYKEYSHACILTDGQFLFGGNVVVLGKARQHFPPCGGGLGLCRLSHGLIYIIPYVKTCLQYHFTHLVGNFVGCDIAHKKYLACQNIVVK